MTAADQQADNDLLTEYCIEQDDKLRDFEQKVTYLLNKGWELYGNPIKANMVFAQALTRTRKRGIDE